MTPLAATVTRPGLRMHTRTEHVMNLPTQPIIDTASGTVAESIRVYLEIPSSGFIMS